MPLAPFIALSDNVLDLEVVGESTKSSGELILWPLRVGYAGCQYHRSRQCKLGRAYHDDGGLKIVGPL